MQRTCDAPVTASGRELRPVKPRSKQRSAIKMESNEAKKVVDRYGVNEGTLMQFLHRTMRTVTGVGGKYKNEAIVIV